MLRSLCQGIVQTDHPQILRERLHRSGADKAYGTQLLAQCEGLAARFQVFEYTDKNGAKIQYNLYIPQNLDPNQRYLLVMFIADVSTAGKGVKAPLMQGWGGIIWAGD